MKDMREIKGAVLEIVGPAPRQGESVVIRHETEGPRPFVLVGSDRRVIARSDHSSALSKYAFANDALEVRFDFDLRFA